MIVTNNLLPTIGRRLALSVSFCLGITSAFGQVIQNSSFEEDAFTQFPGYVKLNQPITSWKSKGKTGINPGPDFSPFANNGAIVSGEKVAFLQNESSLSQLVHGFEPGSRYTIWFFENARFAKRGGDTPILSVTVGDIVVVPPHVVRPVGGDKPYYSVVSSNFTATASSLKLSFINSAKPDNSGLIDNVSVAKVGGPLIPEETSREDTFGLRRF